MTLTSYAPGDLLPGTPYCIIRKIGEGGMGRVYEVEDPILGKRFALKTLHSSSNQVREIVLRMALESRALVRIEHPNIVNVFSAGMTDDGAFYYVMELLRGASLREVMHARKQLAPAIALPIALAVATALEHAHAAGVTHRDLKPDNIFLAMQPNRTTCVKVVDFGVAGFFDGLRGLKEDDGMMVGTPSYASPEQQRGEPVAAQMDVWSLGVVLFEMLTGDVPFGGDSITETVARVQAHDPAPPVSVRVGGIPDRLVGLVAAMLEKDASARLASMSDVRAELEAIHAAHSSRASRVQARVASPQAVTADRRLAGGPAPSASIQYAHTLAAPGLTVDPRKPRTAKR